MHHYIVVLTDQDEEDVSKRKPTAYDVYEALRDAGLNPVRVIPTTDEDEYGN